MKKFIIIGGNFLNSGAEAMTYVTVSELRRRYPNCEINLVYCLKENIDYKNLGFDIKYINSCMWSIMIKNAGLRTCAKAAKIQLLHKENLIQQFKEINKLLDVCDAVFDISGYAISSQWGVASTKRKIAEISFIHSHKIPCFLMPQSFGPFDFGENKIVLMKKIKKTLGNCSCIYAREKEGYDLLTKELGLKNVKLSTDIVLQNKNLNISAVFRTFVPKREINITTSNNVAIIPNMRNFDHGNKNDILFLYKTLVEYLLSVNRNIYLISHSEEDIEVCSLIKDMFSEFSTVHLITDKMDSFVFGEVIRNFDFAIASRFHSIVHSYKNEVPCVVLGWATKYRCLAELFEQEQYMFDVRHLSLFSDIINATKQMAENYLEEKKRIYENLCIIQDNNCFDQIDF